jgi:hypothetical protein
VVREDLAKPVEQLERQCIALVGSVNGDLQPVTALLDYKDVVQEKSFRKNRAA